MPTTPRRRRVKVFQITSRGVVLDRMAAGGEVGKPLEELAYVTPRYPVGIRRSDLSVANQTIQLETAIWWFHLNFEPYDLSKDGIPWSGYGQGGGYGTGPGYALAPLQASTVLQGELGDVLPTDVIAQSAAGLPGNWMRKRPVAHVSVAPGAAQTEVLAALVPYLGALINEIKGLQIPPSYGGLGHNSSEVFPLTEQERADLIAELSEAHAAAESGESAAPSRVKASWEKSKPKLLTVALWALALIGAIATQTTSDYTVKYLPPPSMMIHSLAYETEHLMQAL